MTNRNRSLVACALAMSGLLAVACDEPMTGADGGPNPMDGGTTDEDSGTTTDEDGGTTDEDGGTTPTGCDADAAAFCDRFEECNETGFLAAYETNAICRRVVAASCEGGGDPIPMTNGLVDEDACEASRVSSCEGFLGAGAAPIPAACVQAPGDVTAINGACALDAQCGVGTIAGGTMAGMMRQMYCRGLDSGGTRVFGTAECPRGQCITAIALGSACNPANQGVTEFCDRYAGQACAQEFDDTTTGVTGANQCRQIVYGEAGDECFAGSDHQCASGFRCDQMSRRCMAVLNEGQACIPARDLCDLRVGLTCQNLGDGDVCTGRVVVPIGAQCNENPADAEDDRYCSLYARCDTSLTPDSCVARVALGEICLQDPDNCEPGLECDDDTDRCVVPEPGSTTCP